MALPTPSFTIVNLNIAPGRAALVWTSAAGARALAGAYRECGGAVAGPDLGIFAAAASARQNLTDGLAARLLLGAIWQK